MNTRRTFTAAVIASTLAATTGLAFAQPAPVTLLNVSYDPTRELYQEYNKAFSSYWKTKTGDNVTIKTSHGGSGKQARSVIDGLDADVVTLALAYDIDAVAEKNLIAKDWQKRLKLNSSPYTSTIVFLVRKGNPKGIKDWVDLAKPGVSVVVPNPKLSGNGRYTYLAAWGSVIKSGGTPAQARAVVEKLFANVPVFDGGGRAATTTFAQRNIGDALATFESEVPLIKAEFGGDYQVVYPKSTILAENPVSVVDKVVDKKGTRKQAEAYLNYLYSEEGQTIAAKHNLRPRSAQVLAKYKSAFISIPTFTVDEVFGGWRKAQNDHFKDGGIYDQITASGRRNK
ncbi:MAG: sulfate ABC transporter substrate-binding protein [Burkholderiaceae bacterium]|nr:MAG: sulfate ABC transporter substrate-binding protein [Burkholderiaceae bacterium]